MRTTIASPRLRLHPGVASSVDVEVVNTSDVIDGVSVTVRGIDPAWVRVTPPVVTAFPDHVGRATLTFDVPPSCPAGDSIVLVDFVSVVDPERRSDHDIWITVDPVEAAELMLRPSLVNGGSAATMQAEITNRGNVASEFNVVALEPTRAVECRAVPPTVVVAPGETRAVTIRAHGKRPWFGQVVSRNLQITATSPTLTLTETGRFNQRPRIARGVITALIVACIVALWAFIFLFVVKLLRSRGEPQKAVPASWNAHGVKSLSLEDIASSVAGTVTATTTGQGVPRLTVEAYRVKTGADGAQTSTPSGSAATGDDGSYTLGALLPGDYHLRVSGDGFVPVWYPAAADESGAQLLQLSPLSTLTDRNLAISGMSGSLTGKVAVPEGADAASAGTVTVTPLAAGSADTTTAPPPVPIVDGAFTVPGLATPANYTVRIEQPNLQPQVFDVSLGGGENTVLDTTHLTASDGSIRGFVTDAGGNRLGGVTVTVQSGSVKQVATTPTVGDVGSFDIENLPTPRTYVLTFTEEGFSSSTIALDLQGGADVTGISAVLVGGQGTISGTVRDPAGNPLGGVAITITGGPVSATTSSLTAGTGDFAVGSYTVSGLPTPAEYTVNFALPGYDSETIAVGFLTAGTQAGQDVLLHPINGTVQGTVSVTGGASAGGLTVELLDGVTTRTTQTATSPAGSYSFDSVAPGLYTLRITGPKGSTVQPYVAIVEVALGEVVTRDITVAGG